ncbi:MAG: putative membrane protein SirB2 [Nitriliruptoraceae bacterium]
MKDRFASLAAAYKATSKVDPKLTLFIALAVGIPLLVGVGLGALTGRWLLWVLLGVLTSILLGLLVFGRRMQSAQFAQIEGMPGAAAAVLQNMRGQWFVTPAIAVNKQQEMVHRVVGRPGIILVSEGGNGQRVKDMVKREKTKLNRVRGEVPLHVIVSGNGEDGTISLGKLQVELTKMGNTLSKTEVPKLARKLAPLDKGNIPMPKGNIPRGGNRR